MKPAPPQTPSHADQTPQAPILDILQILVAQHYIGEVDVKKATEASKAQGITPLEYLLSNDVITKELIGQAVAEHYKVPYFDLGQQETPQQLLSRIPEQIARRLHAVVISENDREISITTSNPENRELHDLITKNVPHKKAIYMYSSPEDIEKVFVHYRKPLDTRFAEILKNEQKIAPEIINQVIEDALVFRASDIHFEPQDVEVVIRFRVDGVLQEAGRVPKLVFENILNRIKIQAFLKIDEHHSAQDGAIRYESYTTSVDMRVSIVPTLYGETIVIRILSQYVKKYTFADLGLSSRDQDLLIKASRKPFGMILVTGPTGSGKSTTLYALIKNMNNPGVNITTIEDPVEYRILGVNQIQVNNETNLTFAQGLRSIVRQDPDVILVGEIRDVETAEIAVNAALTGHLLLSTFHANDAATAVPRLLDMGVEPFLLSSTLELLIAQRLVRKICDHCRYSTTVEVSDLQKQVPTIKDYFKTKTTTIYRGKGCTACGNTGFKGRIAIYEMIEATPEMKDLVLTHPTSQQIWAAAKKNGSRNLFDDGMEKVKNGVTTIEELLRVAKPTA